jgi:hypothetical protein
MTSAAVPTIHSQTRGLVRLPIFWPSDPHPMFNPPKTFLIISSKSELDNTNKRKKPKR